LSLVIIAQTLLCLTENELDYEESLLFFTVFTIIKVILYKSKCFLNNFRILTCARKFSKFSNQPGMGASGAWQKAFFILVLSSHSPGYTSYSSRTRSNACAQMLPPESGRALTSIALQKPGFFTTILRYSLSKR